MDEFEEAISEKYLDRPEYSRRTPNYLEGLLEGFNDWEKEKTELEEYVELLEQAARSHPDTRKKPGKNNNYSTFDERHIETEITVLTGIVSQKWQAASNQYKDLCKNLQESDLKNPYKDFNEAPIEYLDAEKALIHVNQELRDIERKIEDISVMTYKSINTMPSPEKKVLRPGSGQPIASD